MKSRFLISILFSTSVVFLPISAGAAIAKSAPSHEGVTPVSSAEKIFEKGKKQGKLFSRLKAKGKKAIVWLEMKILNGTARDYLYFSLALVGLAIIFFALSGSAGVMNVFGAVAFTGSVIFFVLWLLALKKVKSAG